MAPPLFTTARLRLRPWAEADLDAAVAMDADPAVRRYLRVGPFDAAARRARYAAWVAGAWPTRGATWVVEWRERPGFLGWCGVFPLDGSTELEIGYRFRRDAWGQGVATEAGRPVRDWAFAELGLVTLLAVTHPDHRVSQRVLAKLGLEPRGTGVHYGREVPVFGLNGTDWRAGR